jgi:hypothetical protein
MRASLSLFFPDLRPVEDWPQHSTRVKLSSMVGVGSAILAAVVANFLWERLADGPGSDVKGINAATAAQFAIIFVTAIISYHAVMTFGSERRIPLVERLFTACHWATFIALLAIAIPWLSRIRYGDAGSLMVASIAFAIVPLRIGRLRPIGCLLIAIVSAFVFVLYPGSDTAVVMAGCAFLYLMFPWLEVARISAQSAPLAHKPL